MLRTKDKSQWQRCVYIVVNLRETITNSQLQIVLSSREMSVSPLQVVLELVNSPRAVGCAFSHFSTACWRLYCSSRRHVASSRRKSTNSAPSWYFMYGLAPFRRHMTYNAIGLFLERSIKQKRILSECLLSVALNLLKTGIILCLPTVAESCAYTWVVPSVLPYLGYCFHFGHLFSGGCSYCPGNQFVNVNQ